jgi:hypothetical protein
MSVDGLKVDEACMRVQGNTATQMHFVFKDRILLTMGISTYVSVGCAPGNIQSISSKCVKNTTISSTTRSAPIVRDSSRTLKSSTRLGLGKLPVELLELLSSGAALHR